MTIRFFIFEGRQYKVGSVKFTGNKVFNEEEIRRGLEYIHNFEHLKGKLGAHGLPMDVGDIFTPDGLDKDRQAVEDFYGSKGYISGASGGVGQGLSLPNRPHPQRGHGHDGFGISDERRSEIFRREN